VQDLDFAPSIVFLLHYAALLPFIVWRFARADRRTFLQLNTISFAIQRVRARPVSLHFETMIEPEVTRSFSTACVQVRRTGPTEDGLRVVCSPTHKSPSPRVTSTSLPISCFSFACSSSMRLTDQTEWSHFRRDLPSGTHLRHRSGRRRTINGRARSLEHCSTRLTLRGYRRWGLISCTRFDITRHLRIKTPLIWSSR